MIRFEGRLKLRELLKPLNEFGARNQKTHKPLTTKELEEGLSALEESARDYGLVDLDDEQHRGLLYHWIVQVRTVHSPGHPRAKKAYEKDQADARFERELDSATYTQELRKLVIIGAGSAAAYYVNALGEGYDHTHTTLVGELDPWRPRADDRRSRGTGYINHEPHLIAQWGKQVSEFSTTYMERDEFADSNAAVLKRIKTHLEGQVSKLSLDNNGWVRIELKDKKPLWAKKVVLASGAGPHARRGFDLVGQVDNHVMDLDAFMRQHPSNLKRNNQSVIVHGPNAGIDAVERAGECAFEETFWFMSESSSPVFLSGNRLVHAPNVLPTKLIERDAFAELQKTSSEFRGWKSVVRIEKEDQRIKVSYVNPEKKKQSLTVDLYVYALGQDGAAEGAVMGILDEELKSRLVPTYDIQGRHASKQEQRAYQKAPEGAKPRIHEKVILGFQLEGTTFAQGLEIIGAAANQVAVALDGRNSKERQDKMNRVVKTQPGTVLTNDQLGTIKSALGAQNAVMPPYVTREVNFSTDDRTVLRTHIAVKYPNVSEAQAQRIIEEILAWRRTTDKDMTRGYHPLGYDAWWQRHFRQILEYWNAPPSKRQEVARKHALEKEQKPLKGRSGFQTI